MIKYLNKKMSYVVLITIFAGLYLITGCTAQKQISNQNKQDEEVVSVKEKGITEESLNCITCHEQRGITHGWIADWQGSMHARKGVGCEVCHVSFAEESGLKEATELEYLITGECNCDDKRVSRHVIAGKCGKCHIKQYNEFMKSRHSISWERMLASSQYMAITKEVRTEKCEQCHNIQFKCDSCHTRHTFDTFEAKTPEACRTCHMGPDNPHYEIYISSKHGAVYTASQSNILRESQSIRSLRSPVCVTCHMPLGNHDIGSGIAYGPVGNAVSYIDRNGLTVNEVELLKRRNDMLTVCNECHSPYFAKKTLKTADSVHAHVNSIVTEVKEIVSSIEKDGLVPPFIDKLQNTTLPYHVLMLKNSQTREIKSRIERSFYKLIGDASVTWKGAYHMNPNYTHLYGWTDLQKDLNEIKEESEKLRERAEIRRKLETKLR